MKSKTPPGGIEKMNNSIDKLTLSLIVFLTVVVLGSFAVIEYQCMFIRDECANNQIELKKASEKMEKLSNQASDPDGKKAIDKAIETKSMELYSKGFNSGYDCGYGFGYIDCHDGRPYSAEIPESNSEQ